MDLGAFSVSLAVKDLEASRQFYEKFGFKAFAGDASKNLSRWNPPETRFSSISTSELESSRLVIRRATRCT